MKKIGLIGGLSWQSSCKYYQIINELVTEKLGGHHSCESIMYSFDFEPMLKLINMENWEEIAINITMAAQTLEKSDADFVIMCCNTLHIVADKIQEKINIPLLHIVDMTGKKVKDRGLKKIGLLGTKWTMEKGFYKERLMNNFGVEVIVPCAKEREFVNDVGFDELDFGIIKDSSRQRFQEIIKNLIDKGAEGVVLGCTELSLLIQQEHSHIPIFDSTLIHAESAVKYALENCI